VIINDISEIEGNDLQFTISFVSYNNPSISVESTTAIDLNLFTSDGTESTGLFDVAISPFDYTALVNTPITIPAFSNSFDVTITSLDDNISELDELFTLNAEITSNNTINNLAKGIGTILDNEALPNIIMNNDIVNEGDILEYSISISNPSSSPVDINIITADNTAGSPADFEAISTILSIDGTTDPGIPNLSVSFSIPTFLDNLNEPDAEILGVLGGVISNNIGIEDLTKTGTILDIDPEPFLVITDDVVIEGGTLGFTITLLNQENQPMSNYRPINLELETIDITTTVNRDYNYFFADTAIAALETSLSKQIPTINDNLNEETEFMNLRASIFSEDISNTSSVLNGLGTIKDNDIPNLFSPNNDGQSDVFRIDGLADFPNFKLIIIDRWGGEIYNYSNNGSLSPNWWDGTKNGNPVIEGVYFYTLDYNDGITKPKTGFIQLMR
jgi:gliding motility-associated-like protein